MLFYFDFILEIQAESVMGEIEASFLAGGGGIGLRLAESGAPSEEK
jgi:hypothetical protein